MTSAANDGGRLRRAVSGILFLFATAVAGSQSPAGVARRVGAPPLRYAVVSIRPAGPRPSRFGVRTKPDETDCIQTLKALIGYAYGIRPEFIFGGPTWTASDFFEIDARVDAADVPSLEKMSYLERAYMLRPVLELRFGLKIRRETRVLRVFDLVVTKAGPGPKFTPHSPSKPEDSVSWSDTSFSGSGVQMAGFTKFLSETLSSSIGRPIIDKTGLGGKYDMTIVWSNGMAASADEAAKDSHPDIFTAMKEQLGLKLKPNQEPVETMVIDSASKPSDN